MKIAIATDAWLPQTNGVVRTLTETRRCLENGGDQVLMVTPEGFGSVPCPTYPEIRLALFPRRRVRGLLDGFRPDALHISTEGPIGLAARRWALSRGRPFTTAYHTQFPRYVRMRVPIPERVTYRYLRWFHTPAVRTMVPTPAIKARPARIAMMPITTSKGRLKVIARKTSLDISSGFNATMDN